MTILTALLFRRALLLDFDGPVCGVFAGYPAPDVASHLRTVISNQGHQLADLDPSTGPIEILHWAEQQSHDLTVVVEQALERAEQLAVKSASPTPHAAEVIRAANDIGRPTAIVSNNSPVAIQEYLAQHGLVEGVAAIVGRPWACPSSMKPNPAPIREAAHQLGVSARDSVLIGDAPTDIEAAHAAGAAAIGFANKPHKAKRLIAAGSDTVVASMSEIVRALTVVGTK